jgi:type IV pilus assembly protein PilX
MTIERNLTPRLAAGSDAIRRQQGAALVVGMIMLAILTLLGISGLVTATLELQMAGNAQNQERAFQAAEAGIEDALLDPALSTSWTLANMKNSSSATYAAQNRTAYVPGSTTDQFETRSYYDTSAGATPVPFGGHSLGTGLEAYHFVTESTGTAPRGSRNTHVQSFYVLGPGGGT